VKAEGQGISDYNRLIATKLSIEVQLRILEIELEKAKRWNGVEVSTYLPLTAPGSMVTLPAN
jgi:hypothetical protein